MEKEKRDKPLEVKKQNTPPEKTEEKFEETPASPEKLQRLPTRQTGSLGAGAKSLPAGRQGYDAAKEPGRQSEEVPEDVLKKVLEVKSE